MEGMFDEINAWDAELRCSDTLRLATENLSGREVLRCEYHRFDETGTPLPLWSEKDGSQQEGPLIFLSGGGYIYSVYKGTKARPGPLYSTFGCDEPGACFDPRDMRLNIDENTKHKEHKKRSNLDGYEYWKRHPTGK